MSDLVPRRSAFPWYLASSSLWLAGMSVQGFVIPWILVGTLATPADIYSYARVAMELPPIVMLVIGGMLADRLDGRRMLIVFSFVAAAAPALMAAGGSGWLTFTPVVAFGVVMALAQSLSDPGRQAMLSRVSQIDIQRTVTLTTIVTSLVATGSVWIGGRLEALGLDRVLLLQTACFTAAMLSIARLPALAPHPMARPEVLAGLRATWRVPIVRNVIGLNFVSSLFNAGAYIVAVPFIVKDVYGGDGQFFANVLVAFTIGSIGSNVLLYLVMPLTRPGRLFLALQLTRVVILALIWTQPPTVLFFALVLAWGLNMGVTSTLVRTIVQEMAPAEHRAQVLALLLASFMVGSPLSALLLGQLVTATGPLTALLPGIPISVVIFFAGLGGGLWHFAAPSGLRR